MNRVLIVGDGGWGTALALLLDKNGKAQTKIWSAFEENAKMFNKERENIHFLPGITIPETISFLCDPSEAIEDVDIIVFAVPSRFLNTVLQKFDGLISPKIGIVSVIKGFDPEHQTRISETIARYFSSNPLAVLSGPSHAEEVARGIPTAVVVASYDKDFAERMQILFSTKAFRIYTSTDVCGVELGGALKNVIAIAAGISDGLGFGDNTKAALMTRGLAEMIRFGVALGAHRETFSGLSGIGDLIVTCTSKWSRNRNFGERVGRGETIKEISASTKQIAEGTTTVAVVAQIAKKLGVSVPITDEVYAVIYEDKKPVEAVSSLLTRELKSEQEN